MGWTLMNFKQWLETSDDPTRFDPLSPAVKAGKQIVQLIPQIDPYWKQRTDPEVTVSGSPSYAAPEQLSGQVELEADTIERFLYLMKILHPLSGKVVDKLKQLWLDFRNTLYQSLDMFESFTTQPHLVHTQSANLRLKEILNILPKLERNIRVIGHEETKEKFYTFYRPFMHNVPNFKEWIDMMQQSLEPKSPIHQAPYAS
jgi:hypothetical protein